MQSLLPLSGGDGFLYLPPWKPALSNSCNSVWVPGSHHGPWLHVPALRPLRSVEPEESTTCSTLASCLLDCQSAGLFLCVCWCVCEVCPRLFFFVLMPAADMGYINQHIWPFLFGREMISCQIGYFHISRSQQETTAVSNNKPSKEVSLRSF